MPTAIRAASVPTTPPPITVTLPGLHAGDAAEEHAAPAIGLLQRRRRRLDRQPSGHLAHRGEERQAAGIVGHRLIGDRGDAGLHQAARLLGVGGKMEIGVEDLALVELRPFLRLRLLDLHDHVGRGEDFRGGRRDLRAGGDIGLVLDADPGARAGLDQHGVAVRDVFGRGAGGDAHPRFAALDLFRNAYQHGSVLPCQHPRAIYPFSSGVSVLFWPTARSRLHEFVS